MNPGVCRELLNFLFIQRLPHHKSLFSPPLIDSPFLLAIFHLFTSLIFLINQLFAFHLLFSSYTLTLTISPLFPPLLLKGFG